MIVTTEAQNGILFFSEPLYEKEDHVNVIRLSILVLFIASTHAYAGGLEDALKSVKSIEANVKISKAVREEAGIAAVKIKRAALIQSTWEDALAERITKLEEKVRLQKKVNSASYWFTGNDSRLSFRQTNPKERVKIV